MHEQHQGVMVIRAELCDRLERLRTLAARRPTGDMTEGVESIRLLASAYGLHPVVRLSDALLSALRDPGPSVPTGLLIERMGDAIGCTEVDEDSAQALLASVSIRLAG